MALYHSPLVVTDGLVLYLDAANTKSYPGAGAIWNDLSGQGNNGTLTNGPTFNSANNGSIVFDGTDDVVRVTQQSGLTPTYFTTESWIKLNTSQASRVFIATFSESESGIGMGINDNVSNNVKFFTSGNSYAGYDHLYQIGTLNNNQWYHVVCTYDGTQKILYINGELNTSKNYTQAIGYTGNDFTVGGLDYNGSIIQSLNGNISLAKMYNRALSPTEITQNFNALRTRFGI
jgi:hypothetical protein